MLAHLHGHASDNCVVVVRCTDSYRVDFIAKLVEQFSEISELMFRFVSFCSKLQDFSVNIANRVNFSQTAKHCGNQKLLYRQDQNRQLVFAH